MPALALTGIDKTFDGTAALSSASLAVAPGSIHALLGENGAGKTTLMRIAFGMLPPDSGTITIDGMERRFDSTASAIAAGIGMVHQHFALVPVMTVAENIALGGRGQYRHQESIRRIRDVAAEAGLSVDPAARVSDLSIGGQQRVEIVKALTRGAQILILDEPTAVLPPAEAASLLDWLRRFVSSGRSAILITHKVREALRVADHVTVLRQGKTILSAPRAEVTEEMLASLMVEQVVVPSRKPAAASKQVVAELEDVSMVRAGRTLLQHTTLTVRAGEILGIAGVEGSGHQELLRLLAQRIRPQRGVLRGPFEPAFIPEDRHRDALALDMSSTENIALRGAAHRRGRIRWSMLREKTIELAGIGDVRGPVPDAPVRQLSGGNQQKLVIARELDGLPTLVVAENPTRGLDVRSTQAVHSRLFDARAQGAAVVVYSSDIEELLSLADRVVVVHTGAVREVPLNIESVARALVGVTT